MPRRVTLALIFSVAYVGGPFIVVYGVALAGGYSNGTPDHAWQEIMIFLCFFWLVSSLRVVPKIFLRFYRNRNYQFNRPRRLE